MYRNFLTVVLSTSTLVGIYLTTCLIFFSPETSSFLIFIVAFLYLDGLCVLNGIIEMKMLWQDLDGQNTL